MHAQGECPFKSRRLPRRTHNITTIHIPPSALFTPDLKRVTLSHPYHCIHHNRHHAPYLLYAPVARSHRFADPEPTAFLFHHQEWQVLRQGQHWYATSHALNLPRRHGLIVTPIGHNFRKSVHPGAFGPDLAKKLSQLVKMEKNVMRSMELVGRERMEVAVSFTIDPHHLDRR